MNRRETIPVFVVSLLLLAYALLVLLEPGSWLIGLIFFLSPLLVIWLVCNVIRFGEYRGRELRGNEEWGYTDREFSKPAQE